MKSHPYAETTGGGVPLAPASTTLAPCQHIDRRGHHCRLFSADPSAPLCPHHTRLQLKQQRLRNDANAAELLGDIADFSTADTINVFLGNLVKQLARKRIARRDAIALAYISQLLLNSLSALDRQFDDEKDATAAQFLFQGLRGRTNDNAAGDEDSADKTAAVQETR